MTCDPDFIACQLELLRGQLALPDYWATAQSIAIGLLSLGVAAWGVKVATDSNRLARQAAVREVRYREEERLASRRSARLVFALQIRDWGEERLFDALRGKDLPADRAKGWTEVSRASDAVDEETARPLLLWVHSKINDARGNRAFGHADIDAFITAKGEMDRVAMDWVENTESLERHKKSDARCKAVADQFAASVPEGEEA